MFAVIDTKGATHIAIHIPKEGSDKSLPALAAMLENNSTFIRRSWSDLALVKPEMTIHLGDSYSASEERAPDLTILSSPSVIDESFVIATPEVMVSNKRALESKDADIKRISTELAHTKAQLELARARIAELEGSALAG